MLVSIAGNCGAQNQSDDQNMNFQADQQKRVAVPPMSEKAVRYYKSGTLLWVLNTVLGLLIPVVFLFTGFSSRIRNWAQRVSHKWFLVIAIYFLIFTIINFIIYLPLSYYQDFVRQHAYGLSNQTFNKWMSDSLKGLLVGLIIGVLFLWVPYLLLKKSPRRWWLYTGILSIPFFILIILISPIWIDPLFNKFGPMKNKELEQKILALADRAGISGGRVYEVDKSVDTKTVNAYVSGFHNTKRIVLWDTIISKLNQRQLLVVMGHEMGHYVLNHVYKMLLAFGVIIAIGFGLTAWAYPRLAARYPRWGVAGIADPAGLPVIVLIFTVYTFLLTPLLNTIVRTNEYEADVFGLNAARQPDGFAEAALLLSDYRKLQPSPLEEFIFFDHPSGHTRIFTAMRWKAEQRR
jgi:Zn-dependent protease with chaperone function